MKKLFRILLALVSLTYLLIVWGAVVRGSGSGLGCPDWPLCHGQIIPPFQKDVLIEYIHRLLASLVSFATLGICIAVWLKKEWSMTLGKWCGIALALLLIQVGLGGVTVKTELHPYTVATHLGVALIFLATIFHILLKTKGYVSALRSYLLVATIVVLFTQMVLGSLVAASNAGLACPDFPTCQGAWIPVLKGSVGLHFSHRVGAILVFLLVLFLRRRFIFFLALLQILLGIGAVLLGLPFWVRVAHSGVAVLLFLSLIVSNYELRRLNHP